MIMAIESHNPIFPWALTLSQILWQTFLSLRLQWANEPGHRIMKLLHWLLPLKSRCKHIYSCMIRKWINAYRRLDVHKVKYEHLLIQHIYYSTNKTLCICYQHYYATLYVVDIKINVLVLSEHTHIFTLSKNVTLAQLFFCQLIWHPIKWLDQISQLLVDDFVDKRSRCFRMLSTKLDVLTLLF